MNQALINAIALAAIQDPEATVLTDQLQICINNSARWIFVFQDGDVGIGCDTCELDNIVGRASPEVVQALQKRILEAHP